MEWTQVIVILGVFVGAFLYLANKIDSNSSKMDDIRNDLTGKVDALRNDLSKEIQKNREEILWIKFRLDPHEHPQKKEEEAKEN